DGSARGADLGNTDPIQERDRYRAGTRVELADVPDGAAVEHRLAGVQGGLAGIPAVARRGRVVERLENYPVLADQAADLRERQLLAAHHRLRADPRRAVHRRAR